VRASDIVEPPSIGGLRFELNSSNIVLAWPSDRRESFAVLWRSTIALESPWNILTDQLHASPNTDSTTFIDVGALKRIPALATATNIADYYRVFVIPDFWFDMTGIELDGGPKQCGEDFLPLYNGSKETWDFFKPEVILLVDGEPNSDMKLFHAEEDIERVNLGTRKTPRWTYSRGLWFKHDSLPNGEHTLQLRTSFNLNSTIGPYSQYLTLTNNLVHVQTSNDITFAEFQPLITGSNYTFIARSVALRVGWRYEVRDFKGHFLANHTGRTVNGDIRWGLGFARYSRSFA